MVISHAKLQINMWMLMSGWKGQRGIKMVPFPSPTAPWIVNVFKRNSWKENKFHKLSVEAWPNWQICFKCFILISTYIFFACWIFWFSKGWQISQTYALTFTLWSRDFVCTKKFTNSKVLEFVTPPYGFTLKTQMSHKTSIDECRKM